MTDTTTPDRPIAYVDDQGRICYRASAIGGCSKALVAARLGLGAVSMAQWLQDKLDESRKMEAAIVEQYIREYRDTNVVVWPALVHSPDDNPMSFKLCDTVNGPVWVTGHGDAFTPSRDVLGEIKAVGDAMFRRLVRDLPSLAAHPAYAAQLTCYLRGYGCHEAIYLVRNKDTDELCVQDIKAPQLALGLDQLAAKVQLVEEQVAAGGLPDTCDVKSFLCGYPYLHDELEVDELDGAQAAVLDGLCEAYNQQREAEARAKGLKGELGAQIAKYMEEKGERGKDGKLRVGGAKFQATLVEQPGREYLSEGLIRKAGLDPAKFKERGKGFSYPLVKPRGEEAESP